jgi:protein TonB
VPREPEPDQPAPLIEDTPALSARPAAPRAADPAIPTGAIAAPRGAGVPGPRDGLAAGPGQLFSTGDHPVRGSSGAPGGSGGDGRPASGPAVASAPAGVTSFARPLGGYQTQPRYPDSARIAGIEGETTLRFVVQADGMVGAVNVERSAGHPDLDRAAAEAVKTWRFEPARRGKEAVAVWVTLPVRFELTHR